MSFFQASASIDATLARAQRMEIDTETGSGKLLPPRRDVAKPADLTSNPIYERSLPSLHFLRWRPMYHVLAANAWMNDPCAPGFDSSTGLYHLSFQWNPKRNMYGRIAWGNIVWGHATSRDLISWTVSAAPSIQPGKWYDKEGCFTGCMVPVAVDGSEGLTIFYTGVTRLPLHFSLPYVRQTETLNMARSTDGGTTWIKDESNPILPDPPANLIVTGWRDPMVAPWPSLDLALGGSGSSGHSTLYGLISGGIKERGPAAFLYAIDKHNIKRWTFICNLVDLGLNQSISRWSGDMGVNWECANFTTVIDPDDGTSRELIIVGGEGSRSSKPDRSFAQHPQQQTCFPRAERSQQWMCGTFVTEQRADGKSVPRLKYTMGGRFDHGIAYGCNSFKDPKTSRQIVFGWITEEDLPQTLIDRQNWSGLLSLPRQVGMQTLRGVKSALVSPLSEVTSIEAQPDSKNPGTFTIRTLSIAPAKHIEALRQSSREISVSGSRVLQNLNTSDDASMLKVQSCRFELFSLFSVSNTCKKIGLSIYHTQEKKFVGSTTISLLTATETIHIHRPDLSHVHPDINTLPETAPFTLFEYANGTREQLEIRAWFDESVLEVFVNERCVISTRVYSATRRCWGIRFWAEDEAGASRLVEARAWDGLRADIRVTG